MKRTVFAINQNGQEDRPRDHP